MFDAFDSVDSTKKKSHTFRPRGNLTVHEKNEQGASVDAAADRTL